MSSKKRRDLGVAIAASKKHTNLLGMLFAVPQRFFEALVCFMHDSASLGPKMCRLSQQDNAVYLSI